MKSALVLFLTLTLSISTKSQNWRDPATHHILKQQSGLRFRHVAPMFAFSLVPTAFIQLERMTSPSREANAILGVCLGFNLFFAGATIRTLKTRKL